MKQLFLKNGVLQIASLSGPLLDEYSLLVKTHYSCVSSGTEGASIANALHSSSLYTNIIGKSKKLIEVFNKEGFTTTKNLLKAKLQGGEWQQLGYSASGQVIQIGSKVKNIAVGDYVACAGAQLANHAEFLCVPYHLSAKITNKESIKQTSTTTLGAIALQGVRRAQIKLGDIVLITGLGLLGQLSVQLAILQGAQVIGIDPLESRRTMALNFGACAVFEPSDPGLQSYINFMSAHHGVDAVLICAASQSDTIIQQAMQLARRKATVVIVGDVGLNLSRDPFYKKEIDLLISCSYGPGRYDKSYEQQGIDYPYGYVRWTEQRNLQLIVQLIEQKKLLIDPLIYHSVSLEHVQEGYDILKAQQALGVIIAYETQKNVIEHIPLQTSLAPRLNSNLQVGVIGAGGFAKVKLLPLIAALNNVSISAIVEPDASALLSAAQLYKAATILRDDKELYTTADLDVVVIASPHVYHAQSVEHGVRHSKAVFVEKPLVTTYEQLAAIEKLFNEYPNAAVCVDFNRSFSPFMQSIRAATKNRQTPLMIYYRMNAGFISLDHWTQQDQGGGRLIGEVCHIIDLFFYLTDSEVLSINIETLNVTQPSLTPSDNINVTLKFNDGSVCNLIYTALGHQALPKEYMEIFFEGKSIVMDDYKTLKGYGLPKNFDQQHKAQQKGHEQLIELFFTGLKNNDTTTRRPISTERLISVARTCLVLNDLVNNYK